MYSYGGAEMSALPMLDVYPYVVVTTPSSGTFSYYTLFCSETPIYIKLTDSGNTVLYQEVPCSYYYYYIEGTTVDDSFVYWKQGSVNTNWGGTILSKKNVLWANHDIVNTIDNTIYLSAAEPVAIGGDSGTLTIQSSQILDDSASFVVAASDLASSDPVYNIKWILSSDGEEVKSNTTESFGSSDYGLHLTVPDLDPETEYEIQFILQEDGVDTSVTISTTFTTLAGEGTPDYTGQLDDIQQGIGDVQTSVDNVGTKLDGVQDTLTETKEEITSLPEKIATALTEGIKGLFIPSQEDLTAIKDEYETMLSEKLGFVWQAFDLLTNVVSGLHESLESGEPYEFTFPGVKLPMQGEEFVLVAETSVSLENDFMDVVRPVCGTIIGTVAVIDLFNLCHDLVMAIISGISAYEFENGRKREK